MWGGASDNKEGRREEGGSTLFCRSRYKLPDLWTKEKYERFTVFYRDVEEYDGVVGYKVEPWLKTTTDDMFFIDLSDILTMSESFDIEMIMMYQNYVRQATKEGNYTKIDRKMGYLGNVNDTKEILEKIFKNSKNTKN